MIRNHRDKCQNGLILGNVIYIQGLTRGYFIYIQGLSREYNFEYWVTYITMKEIYCQNVAAKFQLY